MRRDPKLPKMEECVTGRVYQLRCRNLRFGVYDGKGAFFGIRSKWGEDYIDREFHWDKSIHHGTVIGIKDLGFNIPDDVPIVRSLGTEDRKSGRELEFDKPVADGGKGWYYTDTDEVCSDANPVSIPNAELFRFLNDVSRSHNI